MAEFISQRRLRRKRRRSTWAIVHGVLAFAIGLPILLFSAWLNGDLPSEPVQLRHLVVQELPALNGYTALEGVVRFSSAAPARAHARGRDRSVPLIQAVPDFDILAPADLDAISQAR